MAAIRKMNMSDTPFEIHDDEINVEEIMEKIRENIRRRKEAGISPSNPDPAAIPASPRQGSPAGSNADIARDLAYLTGNWDIQNNSYFISSHRPYVGKFLVRGRELVHGEVRRYVNPMFWKQAEFNRAAGRMLDEVARQVSGIEPLRQQIREDTTGQIHATIEEVRSRFKERLNEQNGDILNKISETDEQIRIDVKELVEQVKAEIAAEVEEQIRAEFTGLASQAKAEIAGELREQLRAEVAAAAEKARVAIAREVEGQVQSAILALGTDIENRAWLAKVLEGRALRSTPGTIEVPKSPSTEIGLNYFAFEDRFRGSREDIKQRQTSFLQYFEGCHNVIDLGCGRGEFLELMAEKGIHAMGVDIDPDMVEFCHSKGLDVIQMDALTYLQNAADKSFDGIFIDQVVEHLEPDYLVALLNLCYEKMKFGFYIVVETVNPLSFSSMANFWIDLSHVKPVHPATLKFLLKAVGYREIDEIYSSPVPSEYRLQKVDIDTSLEETNAPFGEIFNYNVDMLNNLLLGAQDYAMIGKK
ncbi:MAG: methionine biosynthesis protein MetW [Methanomicrobiaceae archaeon]|nr:methionine biosynthesis protein MetW [Methanomicrobiaceae archaeon]